MFFDIDISMRRGGKTIAVAFESSAKIVALFGPSGAGKTSILQMVAGLLRPDAGRIAIAGEALFDRAKNIDKPPEMRACGYVFQDARLFPHMSVRRNLLYGWQLASPERRWLHFDIAVGFLGIGHLLDRAPRTLSGGEAQRVAIGRALLSGPRILLMDEPLASLDAARRHEIMILIERIRDEMDVPILFVSHERGEVDRLASHVVEVG